MAMSELLDSTMFLDNGMFLTPHAARRAQQRSAQQNQIELVVSCGRRWHQREGRNLFYVGRRDLKHWLRRGVDLSDCEGLAVVVAADGAVVTVVRTDDMRKLKRACWGR